MSVHYIYSVHVHNLKTLMLYTCIYTELIRHSRGCVSPAAPGPAHSMQPQHCPPSAGLPDSELREGRRERGEENGEGAHIIIIMINFHWNFYAYNKNIT